eukprot:4271180-Amphidinium_carterae.3
MHITDVLVAGRVLGHRKVAMFAKAVERNTMNAHICPKSGLSGACARACMRVSSASVCACVLACVCASD